MSRRTSLQRNDNRWHSSPEWYTPGWLLERIAAFLGPDWYDPCPPSYGQGLAENGLATSWDGKRVYCNPPYGKSSAAWVVKAMTEPCREVIMLLPAYTETAWFQALYAHTLLFFRGRVRFEYMGHTGEPAPHPSVLVYRGRRYKQFADAFCDLGPVLRVYRAHQENVVRLIDVEATA